MVSDSTQTPPFLLRLAMSRRFWIYSGITSFFLFMLFQLWVRESGSLGANLKRIGISPEVLLVKWTDYEQWLWIEQNGRRIGLTTLAITPVDTQPAYRKGEREAPGYQLKWRSLLTMKLSLPRLSLELPLEAAVAARMNMAFEMDSIQAGMRAAGRQFTFQAFVENRSLFYHVKLEEKDTSSTRNADLWTDLNPLKIALDRLPATELCGRCPLQESIFLSDAVIPVLTRNNGTLNPGETWVTRAANPAAGLDPAEVRIRVMDKEALKIGGEMIDAWRVQEQTGNARTTSWYNQQGKLVQSEMGSGMRQVQAQPAQALAAYPEFRMEYPLPKIDREWIKKHLDPKYDGQPLKNLIPNLPGM